MSGDPAGARRSEPNRDAILDRVAAVLIEKKRSAVEMQAVVEASGVPFADMAAAFRDTDDVLLSLVARVSEHVCEPLRAAPGDGGPADRDLEAALVEFGSRLREAYASVLVGSFRVFVTESARRGDLAKAFHEAGPGRVTSTLRDFLQRAARAGRLSVERPDLAADHLVGLLREPLYRELAMHSLELSRPDDRSRSVHDAVALFLYGCGAVKEERA